MLDYILVFQCLCVVLWGRILEGVIYLISRLVLLTVGCWYVSSLVGWRRNLHAQIFNWTRRLHFNSFYWIYCRHRVGLRSGQSWFHRAVSTKLEGLVVGRRLTPNSGSRTSAATAPDWIPMCHPTFYTFASHLHLSPWFMCTWLISHFWFRLPTTWKVTAPN